MCPQVMKVQRWESSPTQGTAHDMTQQDVRVDRDGFSAG